MTGNTLRKIALALIIIVPSILYSDCKKQAKCGCGKDVVSTLSKILPIFILLLEKLLRLWL